MQFDLVLLSLGGVQRFIAESRSTADVAGASKIVQELARRAAAIVESRLVGAVAPGGLIFPATADGLSVTNKIVFLAPEKAGPGIARAAAEEISRCWRDQLEQTFRPDQPPPTPGTPDAAWVSVTGPAADGDYPALWEDAQREMVGRRRARVFTPVEIRQRTLCAQSPGLPAATAPRRAPAHERSEALSAAGWAKRQAGREAFLSTVSIASSVFRSQLLACAAADSDIAAELRGPVRELAGVLDRLNIPSDRAELRSVPIPAGLEPLAGRLGAWVTAERWDTEALTREYGTTPDAETVRGARRAAGALVAVARKAGVRAPSPYFAVVVQDLDQLGRALGSFDLNRQREVSQQLSALAGEQSALLEQQHPRAVLVYAGGDDLLAFCPAADALALACSIREQVRTAVSAGPLATAEPDGHPITASTGVVFAHMSNPLRDAVRSAQDDQDRQVRDAGRWAVARCARGGGAPPGRGTGADGPAVVAAGGLERSQCDESAGPDPARSGVRRPFRCAGVGPGARQDSAQRPGHHRSGVAARELIRLVARHGGAPEAGDALCTLGLSERGVGGGRFEPVLAALVARFLSQEAR